MQACGLPLHARQRRLEGPRGRAALPGRARAEAMHSVAVHGHALRQGLSCAVVRGPQLHGALQLAEPLAVSRSWCYLPLRWRVRGQQLSAEQGCRHRTAAQSRRSMACCLLGKGTSTEGEVKLAAMPRRCAPITEIAHKPGNRIPPLGCYMQQQAWKRAVGRTHLWPRPAVTS